MGFYTDGDNEESRGYISVYLFLDVNTVPKGKTLTIDFSLKFVNHKNPLESVKKGNTIPSIISINIACSIDFKTTFPIKGGQGILLLLHIYMNIIMNERMGRQKSNQNE
jgi:hypothetical protein